MKRLKSPVLWCSLAALALLAGRVLTGDNTLLTRTDALYNVLLSLAALVGILNNPTDSGRF